MRKRRPRRPRGAPIENDVHTFGTLAGDGSSFVSAVFSDLDRARKAVAALEERGYPAREISIIMADETRRHLLRTHPEYEGLDPDAYLFDNVPLEKQNKALKGAGAGGALGGAVGALAAALAAVGTTVVIPPLGIIVAGPLAAAIAGAGAGGTVGGLVGLLSGAGMSELRAKRIEKLAQEGQIIVGARARSLPELHDVGEVFTEHGGRIVEDPDDATPA